MKIKNNFKAIICIVLVILILPLLSFAQDIDQVNEEIQDKKEEVAKIKKQITVYQQNIRKKQEEAASLKNQLSIIDSQIAKAELDVEATRLEIEKTQMETRELELVIIEKEDQVDRQKHSLVKTIQSIHESDDEHPLKIFLLNNSLSEYFNQAEYTKELQDSLKKTLSKVKAEKKDLVVQKESLETTEVELTKLIDDLELKKIELSGETQYKEYLLEETNQSEKKFTDLYQKAKEDQQAVSQQLTNLEQIAREKLKNLKDDQPKLTDSRLSWPVPKNKITATFHDPDYPFRYLFEHPAVDIRAKQSTPITAPAEGYVLKVRDAGMGYSYVSLIHADGLSTVYGHVSKIFVKQDEYVARGETIALSGGMPGTPGAGRLSSGPHLHFEVRMNGIPVNPLNYLP